MGNATDTMTGLFKSFLRLSVALVVLVGLSAAPVLGQPFLDPSKTGTGNGSQSNPYGASQFIDALNDLRPGGGTITVVASGSLNDQSGASQYDVETEAGGDVTLESNSGEVTLTLDKNLNLGDIQLTLDGATSGDGINVEFPGNTISLLAETRITGDTRLNVESTNSLATANRIVFTGQGRIEDVARTDRTGTLRINRLDVEEGAPVTFVGNNDAGVGPDVLQISEYLSVSGELDLGGGGLQYTTTTVGGVNVALDPNDLSVGGTVSNASPGQRFEIQLTRASGAEYTVEGGGDLEVPITFVRRGTTLQRVVFEQTSIGDFGFSNFGTSNNDAGEVDFPFLTDVRASIQANGASGTTDIDFGDPDNDFSDPATALTIASEARAVNGANVETGSDLDVTIRGNTTLDNSTATFNGAADLEGDTDIIDGSASFNGAATFGGDVAISSGATVDFSDDSNEQETTTFQQSFTASGASTVTIGYVSEFNTQGGTTTLQGPNTILDFEAPGLPVGAEVPQSTVNGAFTSGSDVFQRDDTGGSVDNGLHNVEFTEDVDFNAPGAQLTQEGATRIFLTGTDQGQQTIAGGGLSAGVTIDRLTARNDVEVSDGDGFTIGDFLRLENGNFITNADVGFAGGTTLFREAEGGDIGRLLAGNAEGLAAYDAVDETPQRIEYNGGMNMATGDELLPASVNEQDRDIPEFSVNLAQDTSAVVTLGIDYQYEVEGRTEILKGSLAFSDQSSLRLANNSTFVRGDGRLITEDVANPERALVFPEAGDYDVGSSFDVGSDGIDLEYVNDLDVITTDLEFQADNDDRTRDLTVANEEPVELDSASSAYVANRNITVESGAALDFNEQTLQMKTVEGAVNNFRVVNDGTVESAGGSTLRFAGRGEARVTGDVDGSANSPKVFTFPAIEVDKRVAGLDTEARRVLFQMNNSATGGGDGFEFNGNFTITNAQDWSPSDPLGGPDPDGVEFESQGSAQDVDVVRVRDNFDQSSGSVLAFEQHTGTEFTVGDDFMKNADESSRFYAGDTGGVATFEVGGKLDQTNGTFYTTIAGSGTFDVGGDVINNSPDEWSSGGFNSEAFEVDGGTGATASVGGSVTQDTTGTPRGDNPATGPIEGEGIFAVEGFNGTNGRLDVGDSFNHVEGTTEIPAATVVRVTNQVGVESGLFSANLDVGDDGATLSNADRFIASTLTVSGGEFEVSTNTSVNVPPGLDENVTNPEPGTEDQVRIVNTDVQTDGKLSLEGYELRQEGDFTLLGEADAPASAFSGSDTTDAGLRGLVRFVGEQGEQIVETDETPSTYFHGISISTLGADVRLESDIYTNTRAGGQGSVSGSTADGTLRPFGTLFMVNGDLITDENRVTILEPEPTGGNDLVEAVSASETRSDTSTAEASPVIGGSNSSKVAGTMRRALQDKGPDTGGEVTDGYVFPVGVASGPVPYRGLVMDLPTDEDTPQRPRFFTVEAIDNPGINLQDGLQAEDARNPGQSINLDRQSLPYYRVDRGPGTSEFDAINLRSMSQVGLEEQIDVLQVRLVETEINSGDPFTRAGIYDVNVGDVLQDEDDRDSGGPNAYLSGYANVTSEGVTLDDGGNIIALASDGEINPGFGDETGVSLSGTVTYGGDGVGGVDVTATSEDTTATTTTDSDGSYSFAGLPAGSYDVTADPSGQPQDIDATDALLAVRDFAGIEDLSDFQEEVADVNDSGDVNATDALLIAQFNLGNVSEFEAGTFASTRDSVDVTTGADDVEIQIAAYGDVDLSGSIGSSSPNTLATTTVDDLGSTTAKTASVSGSEQDGISVPLSVDRNVELGAYTLSIDYPADKVSFEGVSSEDVLVRDADGTVHLAWFDRSGDQPLSLNAGDAFVTMQFTPAEGVENSTLELGNITGELAGADATTLSGTGLQVPEIGLGGPESFAFDGNYPNPVGQRTTISFDLPEQADVSLEVYDVLGRKVMTVPKQSMSAGADRSLSVDASGLSSGTYLYRLQVEMGDQTLQETGQMNVVR
jgi:hypothetical protein